MNKSIKLPSIDEIEKVKIQSAKSSNDKIDLVLSLEKYTQSMVEVGQLCQRLWSPQSKSLYFLFYRKFDHKSGLDLKIRV